MLSLQGSSDKAIGRDQTAVKWATLFGSDPVRSRTDASENLRKALCMGGVFAVGTVLPEKIQHLDARLGELRRTIPDEVLEDSLQVLGCFFVTLVLIWESTVA